MENKDFSPYLLRPIKIDKNCIISLNQLYYLCRLAYMATSDGHFSRPSGMGGYQKYSG